MISCRPRTFALAFASIVVLAACSSSPETGATETEGSASAAATAAGSRGTGGSGGSSDTATSSSGTGTATATGSSTGAGGGGGAGGAATCADAIDAELAMETNGLLFPSESDYPFETVNLKDPQDTGAITPAHLLDLLAMDPQLETEARTVDMFFANLLSGPDAPKYQIVLDALTSELTDLAVIRIVPASPFSAQIHVYVVGRTSSGEVAGISTVSIET